MNEESTIMEKLNYLEGTKTSIKNAIISKGQEISENDTFRSYAVKIADIETGTDTSDATAEIDDVISPKIFYNSEGKQTGGIIPTYESYTIDPLQQIINTTGLKIFDVLYDQNIVLAANSNNASSIGVYRIINNSVSLIDNFIITPTEYGAVNNIRDAKFSKHPIKEGVYDICILTISSYSSTTTLRPIILRYDVSTHALYSGDDLTPYFTTSINKSVSRVREIGWGIVHALDGEPETFFIGFLNRSQYDGVITNYMSTLYIENDTLYSTNFSLTNIGTSHDSGIIQSAYDIMSINNHVLFKVYQTNQSVTTSNLMEYNATTHSLSTIVSKSSKVIILLDDQYYYNNGYLYKYSASSSPIYQVQLDAETNDIAKTVIGKLYVTKSSNNELKIYSISSDRDSFTLLGTVDCISKVKNPVGIELPLVTNDALLYLPNESNKFNWRAHQEIEEKSLMKLQVKGSMFYNTMQSTALNSDILSDKIAYSAFGKVEGSMPNNRQLNYTPTTSSQSIPAGYTSGGTIGAVTSAIDSNITQNNIKAGVTILGVTGNLEPDKPDQTKTVTPTTSQQLIEPDTGYELASVTVNAVTSAIDNNIQAGNIKKDVTILGVTGTFEGAEDLSEELTAQQTKIEELEALLQHKCDFQFKIYDTVAHMEEAEAQEGDKAVVYTEDSNTFNFEGFYRYNGTDWIKLSADISQDDYDNALDQAEGILD